MNDMVLRLQKSLAENLDDISRAECKIDGIEHDLEVAHNSLRNLNETRTRLEKEVHHLKVLYPEEFTEQPS